MQTSLPVTISPSRAALALRCNRRHVVADVLGFVPRHETVPHRSFGIAKHAAAAAWWRTGDEAAATAALEAAWDSKIESETKLTLELARFMVRYYCADAKIAGDHWASDSVWTPVAIEDRITLPLTPEVMLTFRVDRLVQCEETDPPAYVLVDTKTTSRLSNYWRRRWPTSFQQKLYAAAVEEHYGIELDGHYVEGVLKSAPSEIEYVGLDWPRAVRHEALAQVRRLAERDKRLIEAADGNEQRLIELALTATDANPDDCFAFNRRCELYDLCHQTAPDARAGALLSDFEQSDDEEWLE